MNPNDAMSIFSNYYVKWRIKACFGFVTLISNFTVHAQKCCKEKTLWENQKKQNYAQVSHSFKNSFSKKKKGILKVSLQLNL